MIPVVRDRDRLRIRDFAHARPGVFHQLPGSAVAVGEFPHRIEFINLCKVQCRYPWRLVYAAEEVGVN